MKRRPEIFHAASHQGKVRLSVALRGIKGEPVEHHDLAPDEAMRMAISILLATDQAKRGTR